LPRDKTLPEWSVNFAIYLYSRNRTHKIGADNIQSDAPTRMVIYPPATSEHRCCQRHRLHESKVVDLDGDGRPDIVSKSYNYGCQGRYLHEHGREGKLTMITRREVIAGLATAGFSSPMLGMGSAGRIDVGLELYSLRDDMKRDVPGTLERVRQMGFDHVEVPSLYGLSTAEFRQALDKAGLKATAFVAPYDDLKNNLAAVQRNLETLGARWALLPWIAHADKFERADADLAAKDMNTWSNALNSAGYKFAYHVHGYEFQPAAEGTLLDVMAQAADAETVKFQLDTFWIVWPGQDCVALMRHFPMRFRLLHLKDMRKCVTGDLTGHAPVENSVVVGDGVVPWKQVLDEAHEQHVEDYFIEDESTKAAGQIPLSLSFLRKMKVI
jgi:sugar phosphate isomerase/epimerase